MGKESKGQIGLDMRSDEEMFGFDETGNLVESDTKADRLEARKRADEAMKAARAKLEKEHPGWSKTKN